MFNYKQTLETMRKERSSLQAELEKLDRAISALTSVVAGTATTRGKQSAKKRQQTPQAQKQQRAKVSSKRSQSTKPRAKFPQKVCETSLKLKKNVGLR